MDVVIRTRPGAVVLARIEWPDGVRLPVAGDVIDLVDGLPRTVMRVTWTVGSAPVAVDLEVL